MISPDNETLNKYILLGLLLGGGTALATTVARTRKLNKKLREYENPMPASGKDTLVVPVAPKTAMDKSAEVSDMYKATALGGAGILSYFVLSSIYRRIEDNRMKKLEQDAYNRAVNKLVNPEKRASVGWFLDNLDSIRNVSALVALLGAAAWTKKHLDRENVDSEKLKSNVPDSILFRPKSELTSIKKQAVDIKSPLGGVSANDPNYKDLVDIRRTLNENPGAAHALTENIVDAAGYGKWNRLPQKIPFFGKRWLKDFTLQDIPIVGGLMRGAAMKGIGLGGSYRAGWDPNSAVNSYGPPKQLPKGVKPEDSTEFGLSLVRKKILNSKGVRDAMINSVADKKKLGRFKRWYLKNHPDRLLNEIGLGQSAAKFVYPTKSASVKNSVANSYFV